ncbi:hypothetical protein COCMIDRAFT_40353 [Bipolaris oryzae ATCC 44560]|uniref:Hydrophobin n=1 Tax=Bipolaris oryzae ATCC 44560 TaxID=930090 RepID=W6YVC6_COCMI|nr:uncharacterized protein COCMIDRAFT_40353 [Bipolaris oryzae ATCC 44560]EUC41498.1 hypothetical protein COCMIDRAFT_40353 [Bipolaris oryzae ATCC 44560]
MFVSTIVLALAGAASILAAPVAEAAPASAVQARDIPPLGSCPSWKGIYGRAGSTVCCVYSGGPTSCCVNNSPVSVYFPEVNYTYLSCQSPWFVDINNFVHFSSCYIPSNLGSANCADVPKIYGNYTS